MSARRPLLARNRFAAEQRGKHRLIGQFGSENRREDEIDLVVFQPGQLVLIHQTRGDGHWEYARIQAVSGTTLTLVASLTYGYGAGAQVVRVPNYTDVTIQSGGSQMKSAQRLSTASITSADKA